MCRDDLLLLSYPRVVYGERVNLVMVNVYGERVNLVMVRTITGNGIT